jgi:hypothetical protein
MPGMSHSLFPDPDLWSPTHAGLSHFCTLSRRCRGFTEWGGPSPLATRTKPAAPSSLPRRQRGTVSLIPLLEGPRHVGIACPGRWGACGGRSHHPLPVNKHKSRGCKQRSAANSPGRRDSRRRAPSPRRTGVSGRGGPHDAPTALLPGPHGPPSPARGSGCATRGSAADTSPQAPSWRRRWQGSSPAPHAGAAAPGPGAGTAPEPGPEAAGRATGAVCSQGCGSGMCEQRRRRWRAGAARPAWCGRRASSLGGGGGGRRGEAPTRPGRERALGGAARSRASPCLPHPRTQRRRSVERAGARSGGARGAGPQDAAAAGTRARSLRIPAAA